MYIHALSIIVILPLELQYCTIGMHMMKVVNIIVESLGIYIKGVPTCRSVT